MGPWSTRRRTKAKATSRCRVPLTAHQLWMVSPSAPVSRDRDASRGTLYPFARIDDERARRRPAEQWEITTRDELARTGYRARARQVLGVSPLAWDAALYVDVSRRGFAGGPIREGEAWTAPKDIVPAVVPAYASWPEYADHCLPGRQVRRDRLAGTPDEPAPQATADARLRALLDPANRASPWNRAPGPSSATPTGPAAPSTYGTMDP